MIVESKRNEHAETSIGQIHDRNCHGKLADYDGKLSLVGIGYDKKRIGIPTA